MGYQIGTSAGTLTDLASLTQAVDDPRSRENFRNHALYKTLGNGKRKGYGLPVTKWEWALITQEERDQLETFFPNGSAEVYISTALPDGSFASYKAIGNFPVAEPSFGGGYINSFAIEFEFMESI